MNLQIQMLENYMDKYNNPTLRDISEDTGIQITRVFRIFNGQEMKMSEYEILKRRLQNHTKESSGLLQLAESCIEKLNANRIEEIYEYINQKLMLSSFTYV